MDANKGGKDMSEKVLLQITKELCRQSRTIPQLAAYLNANLSTVSTYTSCLKRAGYVMRNEKTGEYYVPESVKDEALKFASSNGSAESFKKLPTKDKNNGQQPCRNVAPEDTLSSEFSEYVSHLNWLLNEYIPQLEMDNQKAQQHANDLMRQMNAFVGAMKQAKVIHNRWVEKQDEAV